MTETTPMLLTAARVPEMLVELGVFSTSDNVEVEELTGGVSSAVFRATLGTVSVVVKQALPQLRVAKTWLADTARSDVERAAAELLSTIAPGRVPRCVAADSDRHLFVMDSVPASGTWKEQLLAGDIDPDLGRIAGELLGTIHERTRDHAELDGRFGDKRMFDELRLDPYLRAAADAHPPVANILLALVEHLLSESVCLVHADFSPKNLLVTPEGDLILVDHEVAHIGDPIFDLAFLLTHLTAKAVHDPVNRIRLADVMEAFARGYQSSVTGWPATTARTPRLIAAIMLARVDGKSPLEYLTVAGADALRSLALELLQSPPATIADHIERIRKLS